jgi:D-alanine-D-alanine ligase
VVFGGTSSEHGVSCLTAAGVLSALDRDRFDVVGVGITRTGRWIVVDPDTISRLAVTNGTLPELSENAAEALLMRVSSGSELAVREQSALSQLGPVDVAFALLHGPFGEDGTIQGLLDLADVRYVGSGVTASAVMMDKHVMKVLLASAGLPVGPYTVITDKDWRRDKAAAMDAVHALSWPVFVKPARAGSSMGITKVSDPEALEAAIEAAREHDPKVVVEAAVFGREIECGVLEGLDGGPPDASVPGEVVIGGDHEFYDFAAKYLPDEGTDLVIPADLPDAVVAEV